MLVLLVLLFAIANVEGSATCASDPCLNGDGTASCTDLPSSELTFTCGPGSGSQSLTMNRGTIVIANIPINVQNLMVELSATQDVDIYLKDLDGNKLAGYGGQISSRGGTKTINGMEVYFSGDDTRNPVEETITVDHTTEPLRVEAQAYSNNVPATISYSWTDIDPCDAADFGRACTCANDFDYDPQYGCTDPNPSTFPPATAEYPDEVGPGTFYNIPNILGGDFCIFFEFVSSTPCKIQNDDNEHWFDGCGMIDGDVPTPSNDFGITMGRQGEIFFGVGDPDVSIKAGSGVAPGYADGSRHRVCAARAQSSGKIVLYLDEVLMGEEYGQMGILNDSPELHIGNTRLHPGYEYEGTLSSIKLWDSLPCCLPDASIMENHSALNSNVNYPDVAACESNWEQKGTLSSGNYIDGDVYILGKFTEQNTLGCTLKCSSTVACAAFSFSGESIFAGETAGECILYKRVVPNRDHGKNTRFCMKNGILPKCSGNGEVCGNRERECWEMCGEAEGYCDACDSDEGKQGACCRKDVNAGSNSICATRVNENWFLAPGYHQCVILD